MDEKEKVQHEHDEACDCGCETVDEDVIMLEDEDGNEIPFYHIATLEHDGKEYACLQQADDEDEPIIEIFELEEVEEDGEPYYNFLPIDDDMYQTLFKQLEEEVAAMGDDECDDPDCECHHHDDND